MVLPNPRHEKFAQARAIGKSVEDAYEIAGYRRSSSNAARLNGDERVAARIKEIQAEGAEAAAIDITRTLQELVRIGTLDPRRMFDSEGKVKPPKDWDDDLAAAISSIEVIPGKSTGQKGRPPNGYKVRFWSKTDALEKIAKHLGMFVDHSVVDVNHHFHDHTEQELQLELASMFNEVRAAAGKPVLELPEPKKH